MINIIFHYFFFLSVIFFNGLIFCNFFFKNISTYFNNIEKVIIGIIFTGFISIIINFFFPLNDVIIYSNFLVGFFYFCYLIFIKKKNFFIINKLLIVPLILLLFLSILQIYGSGFSDDLNHYHGGYIANADNNKIIIGYNYLHYHYGYSSIWLLLHSYLNFNNSFLQDIHIINSIIFFVILFYFFKESFEEKIIKESHLKYLLSYFFLLFFLIKYTRLKEFGLDRPGILIFCFIIYFSLKYENFLKNTDNYNNFILLLLLICLFLASIKIFFISSFLIPFMFILKVNSFKLFLSSKIFLFYFCLIIYFIKSILVSGCIIYPFYFTCIETISWNSKDIVKNLLIMTEASTKAYDKFSGDLTNIEYIKNFNWIATWLKRNIEELLSYIGTIVLACIFFVISSDKKKIINKFNYTNFIILGLFLFNFIIFLKSPVVRYHHILFILLGIVTLMSCNLYFSKKKIVFFMVIFLCFGFNLSKNISRIDKNNFFNNPYQHIKNINWYTSPVKHKLDKFEYYNGWIDGTPIGNMNLDSYNHKKVLGYDLIYK